MTKPIGSNVVRTPISTVYDVLRRVNKDDAEQALAANQLVVWQTMKQLPIALPDR